jgi:acyl carrier protein
MRTTRETLIAELTALILEVTDKRLEGAPLAADEVIFGRDARLALDSLDALQVSMALQKRYRVRLVDSKETRRILSCVGNLADYLIARQKA